MSTSHEQLHTTLLQLRQQLEQAEGLEPTTLAELDQALGQIRQVLEREQSAPAEDEESSLTDRLSEAAQSFEQSHPTLSGTLQRLVDTLGQMGI